MQNLKLNKSPGLDGLTPEFYLTFWAKLKYAYLDMITGSLSQGILPLLNEAGGVNFNFQKMW